jgi:NAD(P)-dependent dehydrogenase (short-subunit alcohol dehydrogenase family)
MNRRDLLLRGSAALAAGAIATTTGGCGRAEEVRPEGVPLGPFDADSTAEEVTAGMDLAGRTVLVTGANSGLGYESMRVLALRGAHVIGTARTLDKATTACESIQGRTTPVALELTDFASVVACARTVAGLGVPLDVLMCNAGVMEVPTAEQVNGIERHFVTNHLGHFLLTRRLLPQLTAAPQGRVVVVSSGAYKQAPASRRTRCSRASS